MEQPRQTATKGLSLSPGHPRSFTTNGGVITITGYAGRPPGAIAIPSVINGLPVASIGNYAFDSCTRLTRIAIPVGIDRIGDFALAGTRLIKIAIPQSVTNIGRGASYSCDRLKEIAWGDSVLDIGDDAFEGCTSLTDVNLPDGLTCIGDCAFYDCTGLTNIAIPATVTNLGAFAFSACPQLRGLFFRGNAPAADPWVAYGAIEITAYYVSGTGGWQDFAASTGLPTMLWNPQVQTNDGQFGIRNNEFAFNVAGTANIPVVLEACTDIGRGDWGLLQATSLTNGVFHFSDPNWRSHPSRFYRLRTP